MTTLPQLPPLFDLSTLPASADVAAEAVRIAAAGADDATMLWRETDEQFDCALIVEPEASLTISLQFAHVALIALGDALGALLPSMVPLTLRWPGAMLVDGGVIGSLRVFADQTDEAAPRWLVVAATLAIAPAGGDEPGLDPDRTSIAEAGGGAITSAGLLVSYCRHLLTWTNRWHEDGFAPFIGAWKARAADIGREQSVMARGKRFKGICNGIDIDGNLILGGDLVPVSCLLDDPSPPTSM